MIEYIIAYLIGTLGTSSIMMWWFKTNIHIHILQLLKWIGFKRKNETFWHSETPIEFWTQEDLDMWKLENYPAWLDELTSCKGCFSFHIAFWSALITTVFVWSGPASLIFTLSSIVSWPYLMNYNLAKLNQLES